ncbi:MAG: hypothetical protein IPJ95_20095 [Gemmatimonadetes bacterium]|nr:hypothetical protein [Gemmatimonadota bacterium]
MTLYAYRLERGTQTKTDSATGAQTRYQYDALGNLLRKVVLPTGDSVEYRIDGQNRRVGRKLNGVVTHRWLYQNQLNPIAELRQRRRAREPVRVRQPGQRAGLPGPGRSGVSSGDRPSGERPGGGGHRHRRGGAVDHLRCLGECPRRQRGGLPAVRVRGRAHRTRRRGWCGSGRGTMIPRWGVDGEGSGRVLRW